MSDSHEKDFKKEERERRVSRMFTVVNNNFLYQTDILTTVIKLSRYWQCKVDDATFTPYISLLRHILVKKRWEWEMQNNLS